MITSTNLTRAVGASALLVALCAFASPSISADDRCKNVTGKAVWTLVPAADPLGRLVGPNTGVLKAAATSSLTSLVPQPNGSLIGTGNHVWVLGPQDLLVFSGVATFAPLAGEPIGTVSDSETLTVISGTGKYAGATGTIIVTGIGYNVFGPAAGPGSTFFDVRYDGTVCRAN